VETTFGLRNTMDSQLSDDALSGNNRHGPQDLVPQSPWDALPDGLYLRAADYCSRSEVQRPFASNAIKKIPSSFVGKPGGTRTKDARHLAMP
jgi:hypothetical protein